MKKSLFLLLTAIGLIAPTSETKTLSARSAGYLALAAGTTYASGNIYARLIERATHYRFDEEMEQLGYANAREGLIASILDKHHKARNKPWHTYLYETACLLPHDTVAHNRQVFPFVRNQENIRRYLNKLWWAQWWTLGQQKYQDLKALQILLENIQAIINTDYRYTQELQKLNN